MAQANHQRSDTDGENRQAEHVDQGCILVELVRFCEHRHPHAVNAGEHLDGDRVGDAARKAELNARHDMRHGGRQRDAEPDIVRARAEYLSDVQVVLGDRPRAVGGGDGDRQEHQ